MDDLPNCELQWVIGVVARLRPPIARWAVFPERGWATTRGLANVAVPQLRKHDPSIPIGGGTPAYFTELNRNRPPVELLDFITWSQQPQVHAIDNASIVETLAAHTHAVESARQICGGLPLVVGPITLKARVNPYATGPWPPALAPGELPPQFDPRQITTFAAGWTLGSIKYLAEAGVQAATYYELFGPQGVMEADYLHVAQVRLGPSVEASRPYCVFPMFHVFADLAELRDAQVFPVRSSDPLRVEALAVGKCLLIANLSREQQAVKVATPAKSASLRVLDDSMFEPAQTEPEAYRAATSRRAKISDELLRLTLEPYSIARVDFSSS
jgi:hypothetical protein